MSDDHKTGKADRPVTQQLELRPGDRLSSRTASPVRLSTELALKVQTQLGRISTLKAIAEILPESLAEISIEEVNQLWRQIEETHKAFLKEHTYFEVSWPSALTHHEHFSGNAHQEKMLCHMQARRIIGVLRHSLTASSAQSTCGSRGSSSTTHRSARLLIDAGSELTFVTENLIRQLNIPRHYSSIVVTGIAGKECTRTRGVVSLTLRSTPSNSTATIQAHVLRTVTSILPHFEAEPEEWPHLRNLAFADPDCLIPRPVDILIGADAYRQIIKPNIIRHSPLMPIAQLPIFGWLVLGSVNREATRTSTHHAATQFNEDARNELLTKFWNQEEVPTHDVTQLTPNEQRCEKHLNTTHSRDSSERYIVRILLNSPDDLLGDSYNVAHQCLKGLRRRFSRDVNYQCLYQQFMIDYETLNHVTKASSISSHRSHFHLTHHGVLKPDSITTKLRVAFNGSSASTSGYSDNDFMYTGAKLHLNISEVLPWIRRHRHMFATDITKMDRPIQIHKDDWELQRILWMDNQLNEVPYHSTTVTDGTKVAPFSAGRTLLQLAEDEGHSFPLAVPSITHDRYVDDIFDGADTIQQLQEVAHQLKGLCMAGGFPLAKWHATHLDILKTVTDSEDQGSQITFDDCATKILGLKWLPQEDTFAFSTRSSRSEDRLTKRLVLSEVTQILDPLGFASPGVIKAKILLQELWLHKLQWDDPLPSQLSARWLIIREELTSLAKLSIPRWLNTWSDSQVELHGSMMLFNWQWLQSYTYPFTTQTAPRSHLCAPRLR
ncbi:PREDICTED: uncharacterized protein LOC105556055 [Vollenhovia emeryi]|uniref:uncharacterized protein LOC105556055 n=1 Tax=Vollenhovia emeryi TaxID=411798 RepID=UPI0005F3D1F0|nr:PREDICTED: uncharacterized protein LOC105556055 [Vollenhovia emeryi]